MLYIYTYTGPFLFHAPRAVRRIVVTITTRRTRATSYTYIYTTITTAIIRAIVVANFMALSPRARETSFPRAHSAIISSYIYLSPRSTRCRVYNVRYFSSPMIVFPFACLAPCLCIPSPRPYTPSTFERAMTKTL